MTSPDDSAPDDDLDLLVDRAVNRSASFDDWDDLDARADADPTVWSWLGRAVRDDGLLRAALVEQVDVSERVELPPGGEAPAERGAARRWGARSALGWAAAVLFAALWWFDREAPTSVAPAAAPSDVVAVPDAPLAVPAADVAHDGVLAELPLLLVSTTPFGDDGRTEVVYVRRTLERTVVDDVLEVAHDEHGLPEPVPASAPLASTESF